MELILGNITFHHFTEEELSNFTDVNKERKAIVHEIVIKVECTEDEIEEIGENACGGCCDSYIIPEMFNGEIFFECSNNNLPISVSDFLTEYM